MDIIIWNTALLISQWVYLLLKHNACLSSGAKKSARVKEY